MKHFLVLLTIFAFISNFQIVQAQNSDVVGGSAPSVVPENIKSLVEQITDAESNEDWNEYTILREEIIQAWQDVNPDVARLYSNSNSGLPDLTADGAPVNSDKLFNQKSFKLESEVPMESPDWGDDIMITSGKAYDISMDISETGDIYVAVEGRKDGTTTKDSVYIYKSTDGGSTWTEWGFIYASTREFDQVELMCFDRTAGSEAYILLFFRFDDGWLRVGRRDMNTPGSWGYYTIVDEGVLDFAVDRNYSTSNYRAMCVYDSSNYIYSTRSEPSSYGTVWQDKVNINGLVGRDLDFAYGWNGAVYTTFNGNNSGNLYAIENTNYADPASWDAQYTITQGNVDTTRHAEIIASREDDPNNKVIVVFEKQAGSTYDLYDATRDNNVWEAYNTWVVPDENKWPSMYVTKKIAGTQNFRAAFEQSGEGNLPPRLIKYKGYDGSIWSESFEFSDGDVTGLQKPEVGDIDGSTPVSAFVGANYDGVYFDNETWVPVSVDDDVISQTPTSFEISQNYPNPFNPSTSIQFKIPENSFVTLKVYNVLGKEVATLLNEEKNAGLYEVTFDATDFSSGIYFYKIEAGNFVATKKMILMK
jgi:hypothetical protein